jgi:hypothetical protein
MLQTVMEGVPSTVLKVAAAALLAGVAWYAATLVAEHLRKKKKSDGEVYKL